MLFNSEASFYCLTRKQYVIYSFKKHSIVFSDTSMDVLILSSTEHVDKWIDGSVVLTGPF